MRVRGLARNRAQWNRKESSNYALYCVSSSFGAGHANVILIHEMHIFPSEIYREFGDALVARYLIKANKSARLELKFSNFQSLIFLLILKDFDKFNLCRK